MRKLVTIRRVADIAPIPNKDRIVCATIDGWTIVVLKDQFVVGDPCVFFEPDCFLPTGDARWQFLVDKKSKEFNGRTGHVLRTIRMGGVYSNGFCLTMDQCPELSACQIPDFGEQTDVTEVMGIVKFDPPEVLGRGGQTKGNFPSFIPKTECERAQNLTRKIFDTEPHTVTYMDGEGKPITVTNPPENTKETEYEVTIKMHGSSMTAYCYEDRVGVCSRNLELKTEEAGSSFVDMFNLLNLSTVLPQIGNYAFQMEICGPGINGNQENLSKFNVFVFSVYDIDQRRYLTPTERYAKYNQLRSLVLHSLQDATDIQRLHHAPILHEKVKLVDLGITNIKELMSFAEGTSFNSAVRREGLVYKRHESETSPKNFCFKTVSESWLASQK